MAGLPADERGIHIVSPDGKYWVRLLIWADDCLIFSSSYAHMMSMFGEFTRQLAKLKLGWKPSSLELLRFGEAWSAAAIIDAVHWTVDGVRYRVACKDSIDILGIRVDYRADPHTMAQHRCDQGWVHFLNRPAFKDRRISLITRHARLRQTVLRTLLYGCGAWGFQESAVNLVATCYRKCSSACWD